MGKEQCRFEDGRVIAYEKGTPTPQMEHVDYGLSAFHQSAFAANGSETSDLAGVFQKLIEEGQLAGFEVRERFYEVGSWDGIQALQALLARTTYVSQPI